MGRVGTEICRVHGGETCDGPSGRGPDSLPGQWRGDERLHLGWGRQMGGHDCRRPSSLGVCGAAECLGVGQAVLRPAADWWRVVGVPPVFNRIDDPGHAVVLEPLHAASTDRIGAGRAHRAVVGPDRRDEQADEGDRRDPANDLAPLPPSPPLGRLASSASRAAAARSRSAEPHLRLRGRIADSHMLLQGAHATAALLADRKTTQGTLSATTGQSPMAAWVDLSVDKQTVSHRGLSRFDQDHICELDHAVPNGCHRRKLRPRTGARRPTRNSVSSAEANQMDRGQHSSTGSASRPLAFETSRA